MPTILNRTRPGTAHPIDELNPCPYLHCVVAPGVQFTALPFRPLTVFYIYCNHAETLKFAVFVVGAWDRQTDRQVIWHDASRSQWQEYTLEIGEILHIFPSGTQSMGDRGSKKAYTGLRTGIYLPTKFGCDRSIVVGCRSRNDRQTDKQNGMRIRLTLCDANVTQQTGRQTDRQAGRQRDGWITALLK